MPRDTRVPPLASDGVFAVTGSSVINAPPDKVWHTLMDFQSYGEWNPFVRGQRLVDASGRTSTSQTPSEGQFLDISPVHLPPTMGNPGLFGKNSAFVEITVLDTENYRAAWETAGPVPAWLLHSERWQTLTTLPDGKTRYDTIEVFSGFAAYLVQLFVGSALKKGFQAMADTLKERAERQE
ncbi:hypothetical protein CC1G_09702 [Coprinopsis cinerea okayama7|uniref:SRPBCC domain-containing protein n=1 Tax=Coprinopsis cinerea (strain Okayama-7 / 130 / ATCC MYA-4618 / FGSC 9003) TaxID=240176 RepID=A8NJD8_COPC7|nr:hypothetical protein CC1G_09702 [Coprinopsis cinerea okayama7\|eukprot:XP_001834202.1 hypothetical protein CC1G_09702 [Coprinopsis cinerea okayama7\